MEYDKMEREREIYIRIVEEKNEYALRSRIRRLVPNKLAEIESTEQHLSFLVVGYNSVQAGRKKDTHTHTHSHIVMAFF